MYMAILFRCLSIRRTRQHRCHTLYNARERPSLERLWLNGGVHICGGGVYTFHTPGNKVPQRTLYEKKERTFKRRFGEWVPGLPIQSR
jgi:hypothetical protein